MVPLNRRSGTSSPWRGALTAAFFAATSLYFAYGSAVDFFAEPSLAQLRQERAVIGAWPSVPGRLVKLTVAGVHISGSRGGHTEYIARGEYTYQVDGKTYQGNRLSLDGSAYGSEFFSDEKNKLAALVPGLAIPQPGGGEHRDYSPNQLVMIHYDPHNPAISILNNKDAKPLWVLWENGVPLYFWSCLVLFGIGMAVMALRGFGRGLGLLAEPGLMRQTAGGKLVFGKGLPWFWLVNLFGLCMAGSGGAMMLNALQPVPGESGGCMAVGVVIIGVLMALAGLIVASYPTFRTVLEPAARTVNTEFRHVILPFVAVYKLRQPLGDFDRVELHAGQPLKSGQVEWRASLMSGKEKRHLELLSDTEFPAAGGGSPSRARDLARQVAQAAGLPLVVDGKKEEHPIA